MSRRSRSNQLPPSVTFRFFQGTDSAREKAKSVPEIKKWVAGKATLADPMLPYLQVAYDLVMDGLYDVQGNEQPYPVYRNCRNKAKEILQYAFRTNRDKSVIAIGKVQELTAASSAENSFDIFVTFLGACELLN